MRLSVRPPLLLLLMPLAAMLTLGSKNGQKTSPATWLERLHRQSEMLGVMPTMPDRNPALLHVQTSGGIIQATPFHTWNFGKQSAQGIPGKRDPLGINARGFHEDVFHNDYGAFNPMRRRRDTSENNEYINSNSRLRRFLDKASLAHSDIKVIPEVNDEDNIFARDLGQLLHLNKCQSPKAENANAWRKWNKRKPEMDSSGFFGDTFSSGFGDFWTMKKKNGQSIYKRKPEMDSAGFYGDTFSNGFGDFWTVKKKYEKRRPEMDSAGFYGDTFSNGFGDFWTVKKRSIKNVSDKTTKSGSSSEVTTSTTF